MLPRVEQLDFDVMLCPHVDIKWLMDSTSASSSESSKQSIFVNDNVKILCDKT